VTSRDAIEEEKRNKNKNIDKEDENIGGMGDLSTATKIIFNRKTFVNS
jgi:hypothetical protein